MSFQTEKLGGHMAAAVSGIDLNQLPDAVTQAALVDVLHDNLVLCVRGQKLPPPAFRDAMALFGTPMLRKQLERTPECAEVNIISSEDRDTLGDGRKIVNGANWHTDDSFMRAPCSLTMLYGVVVPSKGGDTQFSNMYAAYDDLPADMKRRIDPLKVVHQYHSRRKLTYVSTRPAEEMAAMPEARIRWCAPIRRRIAGRSTSIPTAWSASSGWRWTERSPARRADRATRTQMKYRYRHVWRQGDIVIWDNRCTDAQGQRRLSRRRATADAPRDRGGHGARLGSRLPLRLDRSQGTEDCESRRGGVSAVPAVCATPSAPLIATAAPIQLPHF